MAKIIPAELLEMAFKDYLKTLRKEVEKLAVKKQKHEFFIAHGYRLGTTKRTLFLLASETDDAWKMVLARLRLKPTKCVQGICRIRQHEDKVMIVVKSVLGALNLDAVVKVLQEELFDAEDGFSVMTEGEWAAMKR